MPEERVHQARLREALRRCLDDSVLRFGGPPASPSAWVEERAAVLNRLGARALLAGDDGFPPPLVGIPDEPGHLFLLGRPPEPACFAVAVVGTRVPTPSGRRFAAEAASALVRGGATVVSGLARGIDGIAHAAALDAALHPGAARLPTVAVLASGLDVCYPREHRRLFDRIASAGAILTEFPPGAAPLRHHFIRRNRLLSGLSRMVAVVEARGRSGALVTAQYALEQGREVGAVPGDIYSPPSEGTNKLIFDGAIPLNSVGHLLEACRGLGLPAPPRAARGRRLPVEPQGLSEDASRVYRRLTCRTSSPDLLALESGLPADRTWAALLELELADLAKRHPGGYVRGGGIGSTGPPGSR